MNDESTTRELVMVSNRLPVDRVVLDDGETIWQTSPGGLVTAVEPIVRELGCVWVGWPGDDTEGVEPFEVGSMKLVPVPLSRIEIEEYYEGFSNGTLWPLYHDVITPPIFHREWWEQYEKVNRRFAQKTAAAAATGAIVWIHDYQLQLVPGMLRELRPDLTIGFFLHIPFPPLALFAQVPWRRQIVEGMLGADVIGFQTVRDAESFRSAAEAYSGTPTRGNILLASDGEGKGSRAVLAQEFPISIDSASFSALALDPEIIKRSEEIRKELGNPKTVLLGVDRLDYTKGIRHRLKAYAELLAENEVNPERIVMVQVASPSREQVEAYQLLRDEVELTVGRINGDYGSIGHSPVVYLHKGYSREEMVALYLAADVMVVSALRDGMNLVAKEYVACRIDQTGVLVLSEFAGARDELQDALLVNPHDIEGLKAALLRAIHMPTSEQRRRMEDMSRIVEENDVAHWAKNFLDAVSTAAIARTQTSEEDSNYSDLAGSPTYLSGSVEACLRRLATSQTLIVASDFDGTLSPIVNNPSRARMLPRSREALEVLSSAPGVEVALLSGRSIGNLNKVARPSSDWIISGSHGAEIEGLPSEIEGESVEILDDSGELTSAESEALNRLDRRFTRIFGSEPGVRLEKKPFGIAVHTREVENPQRASEILDAASELGAIPGVESRRGKQVREFLVRKSDKGTALQKIRNAFPGAAVLFLGDDATDEDVFSSLTSDDVGIKVGDGDTEAIERIDDPIAAATVLAKLAELRTGVVIGS